MLASMECIRCVHLHARTLVPHTLQCRGRRRRPCTARFGAAFRAGDFVVPLAAAATALGALARLLGRWRLARRLLRLCLSAPALAGSCLGAGLGGALAQPLCMLHLVGEQHKAAPLHGELVLGLAPAPAQLRGVRVLRHLGVVELLLSGEALGAEGRLERVHAALNCCSSREVTSSEPNTLSFSIFVRLSGAMPVASHPCAIFSTAQATGSTERNATSASVSSASIFWRSEVARMWARSHVSTSWRSIVSVASARTRACANR